MARRRDDQLPLDILATVPRIARATARSVAPADFAAACTTSGLSNIAAREQISRGTALRMLKRLGISALKPAPTEPQRRPCPDGFDDAYIANGYDECELIFRASPMTIKRWLEERGSERLRKARAEFVAKRRAERRTAPTPAPKPKRKPSLVVKPELASAAANHLRAYPHRLVVMRLTDDSQEWYVDTKGRLPAAEMVALAEARGFVAPADLMMKLVGE